MNISWIARSLNEALEAAPKSLQIRIRIHVTQRVDLGIESSSRGSYSDTKEEVESALGQLGGNERMRVEYGRPNVHALLENELVGAKGHVSVDGMFSQS